jgi:hypothetical protein
MLTTDFPQNQIYLARSHRERLFSALFAITISLVFLAQLNSEFFTKINPAITSQQNVMLLSFIQKPVNTQRQIDTAEPTRQKPEHVVNVVPAQSKQLKTKSTPSNEAPTSNTDPVAKTETELINVFPESPRQAPISNRANEQSATSTFKYDSASIKQAYDASKSDIQKMAEKAGTPLEDPKLSKHDKFQRAAERAVKPDCLRQGGSILSLFVVAYQVATDHCK